MSRHIVRSSRAVGEIVDGEMVLLQTETGRYFGLNQTGTRIWQLLGDTSDLDRVHGALTEAFPVEPDVLRADLDELVDALLAARLVDETKPA